MRIGGFQNVEDMLVQALKPAPPTAEKDAGFSDEIPAATGADLVAAMQASPYKEIDSEPTRGRMPVHDVVC